MARNSKTINSRSLEGGRGGVKLTPTPFDFFGFKFQLLDRLSKLWHNCSLFVNTSFDANEVTS